MFFGGGGGPGGGGSAGGKLKSKPIVHKLTVSLEELFNGKVRVCVLIFPFQCRLLFESETIDAHTFRPILVQKRIFSPTWLV